MKAYKGFNRDLTCKGFQYEEGKEFETERAECCETGFHACEYPLDTFRYYSPNDSVFHEVELNGEIDRENKGSKVCATKIKIGAKISIAGLVKAAITYTMDSINPEANSSEKYGASSATGDYGASSATGYKGASSAQDPTGVAVGWGYEAKAKGCKGATLVLADWRYTGPTNAVDGSYLYPFGKDCWEFHGAKLVVVDGNHIKEDTYYSYINGNLTENEETKLCYIFC